MVNNVGKNPITRRRSRLIRKVIVSFMGMQSLRILMPGLRMRARRRRKRNRKVGLLKRG